MSETDSPEFSGVLKASFVTPIKFGKKSSPRAAPIKNGGQKLTLMIPPPLLDLVFARATIQKAPSARSLQIFRRAFVGQHAAIAERPLPTLPYEVAPRPR